MPKLPLPCPPGVPNPPAYCFTAIILDAGQGDATLLVYPDGSLVLVDCGCKKNKNVVATEIGTVLDAYLAQTGNRLRALVLTHPDEDHYNLVEELIIDKDVEIGALLYGGSSRHYGGIGGWIRGHWPDGPDDIWYFGNGYFNMNPDPALSLDGQGTWPDVEVRVLSANIGDRHIKTDANPNSVVLLVTYLDVNLFLMGDATKATESFISAVNDDNNVLSGLLQNRHTILKAGHHGSNSSTGTPWIDLIRPEVVFISSDTRTFNGVSIPRSGVIDNLFARGQLYDLTGISPGHHYVQYNDHTDVHEQVQTTHAMLTTLHLLDFDSKQKKFTSYGTSWYYTINGYNDGTAFKRHDIYINPAVGWDRINVAF